VNEAVANSIIEAYQEGDVVWIHDYHLMLVPSMIRDRIPDAKIGFFLHSAFPSSEVFRCLASRTTLLEGLLGSTMIGFQTEEYARHFLQTCSRLLCVEATHNGIYLEERFVGVHSFSIGIDPKYLAEKRAEPVVHEIAKKIRERYGDKKLIVARDKVRTGQLISSFSG
jgi:trehalose 6-phosphate synthase complex regulatory subunit